MPRHGTCPEWLLGLETGKFSLEGFISTFNLAYILVDQHTFPWAEGSALKSKTCRYQERLWASAKGAVLMRIAISARELQICSAGDDYRALQARSGLTTQGSLQTVLKIHKAFRPVSVQSSALPVSSLPPLLPVCLLPATQDLGSLTRRLPVHSCDAPSGQTQFCNCHSEKSLCTRGEKSWAKMKAEDGCCLLRASPSSHGRFLIPGTKINK